MPDFKGGRIIKLQESAGDYPINFILPVCTSATANDGVIPYGDTLSSAIVKAYNSLGDDVTSNMVTTAATVDGNVVHCAISSYTGIVLGKHKLTVIYTCTSGYVDELDAGRILAVNT